MSFILLDAYRYVPPTAASFTHTYGTNSENPTLTDTTGSGLKMTFGTNPTAAADNLRAFTKDKASSSSYDLIARVRNCSGGFNYMMAGICASDGTKFVSWQFANSSDATLRGGQALRLDRWTTNALLSSNRYESKLLPTYLEWLRVGVVSGDFKDFYVSENGTDWILLFQESQTGFLTYTQVGLSIYVQRSAGSFPVSGTDQSFMSVLYFKDPDIVPGV